MGKHRVTSRSILISERGAAAAATAVTPLLPARAEPADKPVAVWQKRLTTGLYRCITPTTTLFGLASLAAPPGITAYLAPTGFSLYQHRAYTDAILHLCHQSVSQRSTTCEILALDSTNAHTATQEASLISALIGNLAFLFTSWLLYSEQKKHPKITAFTGICIALTLAFHGLFQWLAIAAIKREGDHAAKEAVCAESSSNTLFFENSTDCISFASAHPAIDLAAPEMSEVLWQFLSLFPTMVLKSAFLCLLAQTALMRASPDVSISEIPKPPLLASTRTPRPSQYGAC